MSATLPRFIQELLDQPPKAGEGVHAWLFRVARQLHAHLPAVEIIQLLESRVKSCGRHVPLPEITSAVQNSLPCAWRSDQKPSMPQARRWPEVNSKVRETITKDGPGLADLWEVSPTRIEDNESHAEELVDLLFPGNPLLCVGQSNSVFQTKHRDELRGFLTGLQLIVPSPMTAPTGLTKDGKESAHALSNTGDRRFLIVEFDKGAVDEHAALLLHLAKRAPMALVVHSGGKSLHGWFYCAGQPEDKVLRFFQYAVSIGADERLWTRSQFVRMPDGTRDNGKRQTVYFLNPRVIR